jgi:hypothetical protein
MSDVLRATKRLTTITALLAVVTLPASAFAGADKCLSCHEAAELKGLSAEQVAEALQKPGLRAHKRYAKMKKEEIAALLAELAEPE